MKRLALAALLLFWGQAASASSEPLLVLTPGPLPPYAYVLQNPDRLIVEIPDALVLGLTSGKSLGIWQWRCSSLRVVFDLKEWQVHRIGQSCRLALDWTRLSLRTCPLGDRPVETRVRSIPGFGFMGGRVRLEADRLAPLLSHARLKIDDGRPLGTLPSHSPFTLKASPWKWRTESQLVHSTNLRTFGNGPAATGVRLGVRGEYQQYLPAARGYLLGALEQQTLAFSEPRYDHERLALSLAMEHPLWSRLRPFEGASLFHARTSLSPEDSLTDADFFAGLGLFEGTRQEHWFMTLTADSFLAQRNLGYYGQAFRLGGARPGWSLQGTVQRVDPIIRSTPFLRVFLQASAEKAIQPIAFGMRLQAGAQSGEPGFAAFGPYLQLRF